MLSRMSVSAASKSVFKSQHLQKNHFTNRFLHVICQNRTISVPNITSCKIILGHNFIRLASTEILNTFQIPSSPIPPVIISEPGVVPEKLSELANAGLGTSWSPVSLTQHLFDFLHSSIGLPWWGAIILVTITARILCFPLIIKAHKHMQLMSTYMPEFQELQQKIFDARREKDVHQVERYSQELAILMKGREFDSVKSLVPAIAQGSVAITMFIALERMSRAGLPSMQDGGLWWFQNLCISDPFYILPVTSSTTLLFLLADSSKMMPIPNKAKIFCLITMPCVAFFIMRSFPAAVLLYWITTNSITIVMHKLLKVQKVQQYFELEDFPKLNNKILGNNSSLLKIFRQNMDNMKVSQQVHERLNLRDLERKRSANDPKKVLNERKKSDNPKIRRKDAQ